MPGSQPRRPFQQRLASAARRGAYGPPGVPGVYRVPRRTVSAVTSDAGLSAASNDWVQGPDVEQTIGLSLRRMASRGPDMDGWVNDQPRWEASLDGAFDGFDLTGSPFTVEMFHGEAPALYDCAQVQQSHYTGTFNLGGVEPDPGTWPSGATGVEFESAEGTLLTDVDVSGTFRYSLSNSAAPLSAYGWSIYPTTDEQAWYTPLEVGGLTAVETQTYPGNLVTTAYAFTLPQAQTVRLLYQWDAVTSRHFSNVGTTDNGSIQMMSSPAATVTYRPPRYRFTY